MNEHIDELITTLAATLRAGEKLMAALKQKPVPEAQGPSDVVGWCRHEAISLSDDLRDRVILTLHRHATFTALANAMGYPEVQPLHAIVYARRGHELARTTIRRIEHWLKSGEALPNGEENTAVRHEDEVFRQRLRRQMDARGITVHDCARLIGQTYTWRLESRLLTVHPRPLSLTNFLILKHLVETLEAK